MTLRKFSFGAAVALAMLGTGPVNAADLDPALEDPVQDFSQMPVANVTFGSGWYVRGDFGGAQLYQANPFYKGTLSQNADSTFGSSAPGITLRPSHELGYVGGVGGGYAFTSHLRADVVIDYHMPVHSNASGKPFRCINGYGPVQTVTTFTTTTSSADPTYGSCTGAYQANLQSYDALVNGYYDLGTWYNVTPYIGAGVGLSFGHYQTSATYTQADGSSYNISITNPASNQTYNIDYDRNASHTYYNFAYALMAGFAFPIYAHTSVDIGYRYLDLGTVLGTDLHEHEVRAGLRYMIDN
jgi:opacity protein-like surface antigen